MKHVFFIALSLVVCQVFAQQQIGGGFAPITAYSVGDTLTVSVTNTGSTSATFTVPYWVPGSERITYGDADLLQFLAEAAGQVGQVDAETRKERAILAAGKIIKSCLFENGPVIFSNWYSDQNANVYSKLYALTGAIHGQMSRKCGNQWEYFKAMLMQIPGSPFIGSDFRDVNLPGRHSLGEVFVRGEWRLTDTDVDMPFFQFLHPAAGHYLSAQEVKSNPALLRQVLPWTDSSATNSVALVSTQEYEAIWQWYEPVIQTVPMIAPTSNVSGSVTLCPGCSMTWQHVVPTVIDITTPEGDRMYRYFKKNLDSIVASVQPYLDSAVGMAAEYFGVSPQQAMQIMGNGKIVIKNTQKYLSSEDIPRVRISVPQGASTENLYVPGLLLRVNAGSVTVGDTLFGAGYRNQLWADTQVFVHNRDVNYCGEISVSPAGGEFEVSSNERLYDFINGFTVDELGTPDTLAVTRLVNGVALAVTSIEHVSAVESFRVYPNPSRGSFTVVCCDNEQRIEIVNAVGQLVAARRITGVNKMTLEEPPGIYFLRVGSEVKKLIIE